MLAPCYNMEGRQAELAGLFCNSGFPPETNLRPHLLYLSDYGFSSPFW
jgi:hypothetical protein